MIYTKQDDYDSFKCIAGSCPASCCEGWQIVIDEDSLDTYAAQKDDFSARLKNSIDWEEECFMQNGRRCAMLNKQNLCDLQIAYGEECLCETCRKYPRHEEEFEDIREYSLSLSCPEAARMACERTTPLSFISTEDGAPDDFEEFDYLLYTKLVDARAIIYRVIADRTFCVWDRIRQVLHIGKCLQEFVDQDRVFDMDDFLGKLAENPWFTTGDELSLSESVRSNYSLLEELERLDERWNDTLRTGREFLHSAAFEEHFPQTATDINTAAGDNITATDKQKWDEELALEQILTSLTYTYFCGAVYDDCIFSKVALICYSALFIHTLFMAESASLDASQASSKELFIRTVYSYAREVEHSDLNLNAFEDWWNTTLD